MTAEGNLQAPTRHAVAWKNPLFHDEAAAMKEMERVFDICHGCRRCVSLCHSFPTLFDLVDATEDGEVHGVKKEAYWNVVDQCSLCELRFMTKCPYTPPHPWQLDFPHLMLRAKAIKFKQDHVKAGEKLLASTDVHGSFAGIPVVVQTVNAINKTQFARKQMDSMLGAHPDAWMRSLATQRFRWSAKKQGSATVVTKGERTPGRVAIYSTCYVNYNEPGIGHDLIKLLEHNDIPHTIVEKESCCGMPKFELGDLDAVEKHKNANIPVLARYAKDGFAIVTAIPSCTLMFKQELPLLFPNEPDVKLVQDAMWDPFEYFIARHKDGLLKTDFITALGKVSYHIPCHGRVQNIGKKTEEMITSIDRNSLMTLEAYAKARNTIRTEAIAHRKLRSVHLGENIMLQFEDEQTVRRQIQEMLHIKKIFDEDGIQSEIEAYAPLVPDGSNWKATLLIEYPDPHERKRELARLIGVEDRMFVEVEGHARAYAIADEDLERENDEKTSAVHFVRVEFNDA